MHTARYVTLSIATIDTPASNSLPAFTHLIGLSMLIVERDQDGRWSFSLEVATADGSEAQLLEWVADHLPYPATVIGWQVGERLVPALLDAAEHAEAPLAHHFTSRCARTFTSPCIDLAVDHGGVAAPPLAEVAAAAGIAIVTLDDEQRFNAWVFSMLDTVRQQLEQEAIALWRLWLERQCRHHDAIVATADWLAARG